MKNFLLSIMVLLVLGLAGCSENAKKTTEKVLTKIILTASKATITADGEDAVVFTAKGYSRLTKIDVLIANE